MIRILVILALATSSLLAQEFDNLYSTRCAQCHGADGKGGTALGRTLRVRDLRVAQSRTDEALTRSIDKCGKKGLARSSEKQLTGEDIRALSAYVRHIDQHPIATDTAQSHLSEVE